MFQKEAILFYMQKMQNDLTFTEKKVSDQSYSGQIISETEELFSVVYATTYYLLKVQSGDKVTYIPF